MSPERYRRAADDAGELVFTIPPDALRERRFEIACLARVHCGEVLDGAWHELSVHANGTLQWRRRAPSPAPDMDDDLEYRFSPVVPVGQALKLVLKLQVRGGTRRQRLVLEADEVTG